MFNIPILDRILKVILNGRRKHLLSDKLNSVLTPCILIFFSIIISSKQLIGNPINCIIPQEFKTVWDNYVENYCFLAKVYHVSIKEPIPFNSTERNERSFSFYSWIPIILTIQALTFSIPLLIWDYFTENTLINYQKFLTDDQKEGFFRFYMKKTRNTVQFKRLYLTLLYFVIKLFYILNILFQFFTLSRFFGFDFLQWGYRVFTEDDFEYFPYINYCDFYIRQLSNSVQIHTVQCFFSVNLFNKFVFVFVWFWLIALFLINLVTFLYWLFLFSPFYKGYFIRNYVNSLFIQKFVLKYDFFLLLLFINALENPAFIYDFIGSLHSIWVQSSEELIIYE